MATGGSGQAFKFLPVMGELIVKSIYGALEDREKAAWGWENFEARKIRGSMSRGKVLKKEDMALKEDL